MTFSLEEERRIVALETASGRGDVAPTEIVSLARQLYDFLSGDVEEESKDSSDPDR